MTVPGSSVEVAGLLRARGWSLKLLLLAAMSVLAGLIYSIWSTLGFVRQRTAIFELSNGLPRGLSQQAADLLLFGGNGPSLLPLAMILICGCFVLIHRPPQGRAGTLLWTTPSSRFAELQAELMALAVLTGVVALGYAGAAVLALTVRSPDVDVEQLRGICATTLASSAATLCLLGVLLTYWWILGVPRLVTRED